MTESLNKKPMFRQTVDTLALVERLRKVEANATITYAELSLAIGMNITKRRSALQSARRYLIREDRILFGCIRKVGLQRLDSSAVVDSLHSDIKGIGRKARKGLSKSTCLVEDDLAPNKRFELLCSQTLLMLSDGSTKAAARKAIAPRIEQMGKVLPYGQTLAMLQGKIDTDNDK